MMLTTEIFYWVDGGYPFKVAQNNLNLCQLCFRENQRSKEVKKVTTVSISSHKPLGNRKGFLTGELQVAMFIILGMEG